MIVHLVIGGWVGEGVSDPRKAWHVPGNTVATRTHRYVLFSVSLCELNPLCYQPECAFVARKTWG